jgi:hypothetical protein
MALIFRGASRCPLCDGIIAEDDDIVATQHFIPDESDPLWRYSDAAIHRSCFLAWPHRGAFVAKYNATLGRITWGNGMYHDMQADGTIPDFSLVNGEGPDWPCSR